MSRSMTRAEFLEALRATPRTWRLDRLDRIRDGDGRCPLQAVAGLDFSTPFADRITAFVAADLPPDREQDRILKAADHGLLSTGSDEQLPLREQLAEACGLGMGGAP